MEGVRRVAQQASWSLKAYLGTGMILCLRDKRLGSVDVDEESMGKLGKINSLCILLLSSTVEC